MPERPILASSVHEATPKVEEAAIWLAKRLGGALRDVYACEPCEHRVSTSDGDTWTEGWWGVELHVGGSISLGRLDWLQQDFAHHHADTIDLDEVDISIAATTTGDTLVFRLELTCTLSARLADQEADDDTP